MRNNACLYVRKAGFGAWGCVGYQYIGNVWHIASEDREMKT